MRMFINFASAKLWVAEAVMLHCVPLYCANIGIFATHEY